MEQQKACSKFRKAIIILFALLAFVLTAALIYTFIKHKTYNVFDQLYYEVKTVKCGGTSVLVSGTESAYADYDLGEFVNVQIPDLSMCLSIDKNALYLLFFNSSNYVSDFILYKYELKEKQLYGERSLDYLIKGFLNDYFKWWSNSGKVNPYSQNNLGEYSFEFQTNVYYD